MSTPRVAPRSPFASDSWEPRFVVEHYDTAALQHAVEQWRLCNFAVGPKARIRYVARDATCMQVAHPDAYLPVPQAPWGELREPVVVTDVAGQLGCWQLSLVVFPKWFEIHK